MAWSPATLAALQQGSTAPLQENESLLQVRLQEEIQLSLLSQRCLRASHQRKLPNHQGKAVLLPLRAQLSQQESKNCSGKKISPAQQCAGSHSSSLTCSSRRAAQTMQPQHHCPYRRPQPRVEPHKRQLTPCSE